MKNHLVLLAGAVGLAAAGRPALSASPPPNAVHIRGVVRNLTGPTLTVATASGPVTVQLAHPLQVSALVPSDRSHLKDGSFLGITSVQQADGSQRAVEVHVFPESMRGAGEGSYPWDLPGAGGGKMTHGKTVHSKMTNGTVTRSRMPSATAPHSKMTNGTVVRKFGGTSLTLRYKNGSSTGSQSLTIPPGIPIVTFAPGQPGDLKPGAHVFVIATRTPNGTLTASRVLVGKNGLNPPM